MTEGADMDTTGRVLRGTHGRAAGITVLNHIGMACDHEHAIEALLSTTVADVRWTDIV